VCCDVYLFGLFAVWVVGVFAAAPAGAGLPSMLWLVFLSGCCFLWFVLLAGCGNGWWLSVVMGWCCFRFSLVLFFCGEGVGCVGGLFRFCEQASGASAVAQANVVSAGGVWWSSVGGCFRGLVQAPRLVATPRLPADAARLTHVYNCL
jgi:hypothetical protein